MAKYLSGPLGGRTVQGSPPQHFVLLSRPDDDEVPNIVPDDGTVPRDMYSRQTNGDYLYVGTR
jgi:hypothetical protein